MNSIQAEILARLINAVEREGCTDIEIEKVAEHTNYTWFVLEFKIPASPGEQPAREQT